MGNRCSEEQKALTITALNVEDFLLAPDNYVEPIELQNEKSVQHHFKMVYMVLIVVATLISK